MNTKTETDINNLTTAMHSLTDKLDGLGLDLYHLQNMIGSMKEVIEDLAKIMASWHE